MGGTESKPAEEITSASVESSSEGSRPMNQDEVLHTLEKVVAHEYEKIQDELAASALQHANSVSKMVIYEMTIELNIYSY